MSARRWRTAATAGLMVALPAGAAAAAGQDMLSAPGGTSLAFENLAPGYSRTQTVTVHNPTDTVITVALQLEIADDDENGCLRQESGVATEQCDVDGGELDDWLDVTVSRDGSTLWVGPVAELATSRELPGALGADGSWDLDLTMAMPMAAGNDTMTDRIGFDLVARAATVVDEDGGEVVGGFTANGGSVIGGGGVVPAVGTTGSSVVGGTTTEGGVGITGVDAGLGGPGQDYPAGGELPWLLGYLTALLAMVAGAVVLERRRRVPRPRRSFAPGGRRCRRPGRPHGVRH